MAQITKKSEEFFARSKKVSPGGVHSPVRGFRGVGGTPRFIDSAKGAELVDVDGNRYLDFVCLGARCCLGIKIELAKPYAALSRGWSYGAEADFGTR